MAFCRGLVLSTSVCPRVLYAAFSTITGPDSPSRTPMAGNLSVQAQVAMLTAAVDSGLGRIGLEAPDLVSLQAEADAARRNRYRYGLVPKPMEMETEECDCSDRAVRAARVCNVPPR